MKDNKENKQSHTDSPKKASSKKKLVVVILAIFGAFLCVCIACIVFSNIMANKLKDSATDTRDSATNRDVRNNVETIIEDVLEDEEGNDADIELGDLVEGFPEDISIYPRSKVITSSFRDSGYNATLTVDDVNIDDVVEFYKKELKKNGWKITDITNFFGVTLTAIKDTRNVTVVILDDNKGFVTYSVLVKSQEK